MPFSFFSRRDLFRQGGILAAAQALGGRIQRAVAAPLEIGANMYKSIGVRPLINARGTFTIITGSQTLPEVKRAMEQASRSFVNMDELMDGVGKRLAELSGAEWGIVTAGCAAGLTHLTAAAIAGGNPERMQRVPNLAGCGRLTTSFSPTIDLAYSSLCPVQIISLLQFFRWCV